mmetsp:Transcript_44535/g.88247  ORF Transcript_44535/g.88247 Transcript_44535/m.88247 type:complete len:112 (-) Transcript_44535:206-541(-)
MNVDFPKIHTVRGSFCSFGSEERKPALNASGFQCQWVTLHTPPESHREVGLPRGKQAQCLARFRGACCWVCDSPNSWQVCKGRSAGAHKIHVGQRQLPASCNIAHIPIWYR